MIDKLGTAIEKDLQRLGIEADVQFMLESFFMVTFDTSEDMHLYKILGRFRDSHSYKFQVKK